MSVTNIKYIEFCRICSSEWHIYAGKQHYSSDILELLLELVNLSYSGWWWVVSRIQATIMTDRLLFGYTYQKTLDQYNTDHFVLSLPDV